MKKTLFFLFCFTAVLKVHPQSVKMFDKTYGAEGLDAPVFIDSKAGMHYVFGNISHSPLPLDIFEQFGGSDYNLVVYDKNGVVLKNKSFGGSANEHLDKVIPNGSGGWFLIGTSTSPADGNKTSTGGCINNKPSSFQEYIRQHYLVHQNVANGSYVYQGTSYDTVYNIPPVTETNKKELYIVELDSSGTKLNERSICTQRMNYSTISGTTGDTPDSTAYFAAVNDVRKDVNGNYLVSYTYYYEDYAETGYNASYSTVPVYTTKPLNDPTIYDNTTQSSFTINNGAFHSGIMIFDSNWNMLTNKINIYVPADPQGYFSMHSEPAQSVDPNFLNTGNNVYSLNNGGILYTGTFCSTDLYLYTPDSSYDYFTGAYITNSAESVIYSKMFLSSHSQNKLAGTYFDGTYYYLFIEDMPFTTPSTDYFTKYFPGSYAGYAYKRTTAPHTIINKKDIWVIKMTNTLQVISETAIGCNDDTHLSSVIKEVNSNNLILSCYTKGGNSFDKTTLSKGGYDYWIVEFNPAAMSKVSDWSFGGSGDDILTYTNSQLGFFEYTGTSKSGISGDKTETSRDGGTLGDYWTLSYCLHPSANFTADYDSTNPGNLVSFTNLSTYTNEFSWTFGDGAVSFEKNPRHYYYMPGYYDVTLNAINPVGCSDSVFRHNYIYVNALGVIEAIGEKRIAVFPSPSADQIYVSAPGHSDLKIYDSFGRIVKEIYIASENDKKIDVTALKNGMYFINIMNSGKLTNLKFIKN